MGKIAYYEKRPQGRDFVIGDIHGCMTKLNEQLEDMDFNFITDRLFSVGDIIDRGPESEACFKWLTNSPWFHCVRGNHEQMLLDWTKLSDEKKMMYRGQYVANGCSWFLDLEDTKQSLIARRIEDMPWAIQYKATPDLTFGIVHADCPCDNWADMADMLKGDAMHRAAWYDEMVWSRERINNHRSDIIENIDTLFVGHTPITDPSQGALRKQNVLFLDNAAWRTERKFIILRMDHD